MSSVLIICIVGIVACAVLDMWQRLIHAIFKFPPSNWAMVGRWLILFSKSRVWVQSNLSEQGSIKNELYVGWLFHYMVAVVYALFYFMLFKQSIVQFELFDGAIFGLISVIVPWLFFMPAMGSGILASKTPNPQLSCILALFAHIIFGSALGLLFKLCYS